MANTQSARDTVRLRYEDGEVIVMPKDQDVFLISAEKATEACANAIRHDQRIARFTDEIILPLAIWCRQQRGKISACYVLSPEAAVLPVYVIGATEKYDFRLTEALSSLAQQFHESGWSLHLSQIPLCTAEELRSYFNPEQALLVYGG